MHQLDRLRRLAAAAHGADYLHIKHFGALSGALRKQPAGLEDRTALHAAERVEPHRTALERYERFCPENGEEPTTVALAWLLAQDEREQVVVPGEDEHHGPAS